MGGSSPITPLGIQSVPLERDAVEHNVFPSRIAQCSREQRHRRRVVVHFNGQDLFETGARARPRNVQVFSDSSKLAGGLGYLRVRQIKYQVAHFGAPANNRRPASFPGSSSLNLRPATRKL